tara:strand:- start:548 stop:790 length:243 start_codon:yes stop_codon:yes gene_type:complete
MAVQRLRFTFPTDLITEPVIYLIAKQFEVITNIRMADVDESTGWVILELEGTTEEIARSVAWAESRGVRVDPITGDVIEG